MKLQKYLYRTKYQNKWITDFYLSFVSLTIIVKTIQHRKVQKHRKENEQFSSDSILYSRVHSENNNEDPEETCQETKHKSSCQCKQIYLIWRSRHHSLSQPEMKLLQGGAAHFSEVSSDKKCGKGLKLHQGSFRLDIRKDLIMEMVVWHWNRLSMMELLIHGIQKKCACSM